LTTKLTIVVRSSDLPFQALGSTTEKILLYY